MKLELKQKMFDNGVNGVLNQGAICKNDQGVLYMDDQGGCLYRHKENKCIIGHSIIDEAYSLELEDWDAAAWGIQEALCLSLELTSFRELDDTYLLRLQEIHDDAKTPRMLSKYPNHDPMYIFLAEAIQFAKENDLTTDNIEYELVEPTV